MRKLRKYLLGLIGLLILVVGLVFAIHLRRPPREDYTAKLFQGVSYVRQTRSTPRPLMIHVVEIDLRAPGINFLVTPGNSSNGLEIPARTTSTFAEEFGVQIAINGSFFSPFRVGNFLWDYYPHSGDPVDITGLAISNGETYSDPYKNQPIICITEKRAEIRFNNCPSETMQALAGSPILIDDGHTVVTDNKGDLHPRTAIAMNSTGEILWLIVVDGRQPNYSEGVTLAELADIAVETGAVWAFNLDGGGSSALVMMEDKKAHPLNSPIHKRIPMWERPVANHFGVYAQPISDQ